MHIQTGRLAAALVALAMIMPVAMAAPWAGFYGQGAEPSTAWDTDDYVWQNANTGDDAKVYFNGYPSIYPLQPIPTFSGTDSPLPMQLLHYKAVLGFWLDCNNDGFIGNALTGTETYSASLLPTDTPCKDSSRHVNGNGDGFVNEFLHIGPAEFEDYEDQDGQTEIHALDGTPANGTAVPGPVSVEFANDPNNVDDPDARVWADLSLPKAEPRQTSAVLPLPHGSLSSWQGHADAVDQLTFGAAPAQADKYGGDGTWNTTVDVLALMDGTAPTPLLFVKNLYNESTTAQGGDANCGTAENPCEGAYAQPIVNVWDCEGHDAGVPPTSLNVDPSGSLDGTLYQFFRGANAVTSGEGCNDEPTIPGYGDAHLPYGNLERAAATGVGNDKKEDTDVPFTYTPQSRVSDDGTGMLDGADAFGGTPLLTSYDEQPGYFWRGWSAYVVYLRSPICALENAPCVAQTHYQPDVATFYAHVGDQAFDSTGSTRAAALPAGETQYFYGDDYCDSFDSKDESNRGWNCDPTAWEDNAADAPGPDWNVVVGQPYHLRDVDCYDGTLFGVTTARPASPDETVFEDFQDCTADEYQPDA